MSPRFYKKFLFAKKSLETFHECVIHMILLRLNMSATLIGSHFVYIDAVDIYWSKSCFPEWGSFLGAPGHPCHRGCSVRTPSLPLTYAGLPRRAPDRHRLQGQAGRLPAGRPGALWRQGQGGCRPLCQGPYGSGERSLMMTSSNGNIFRVTGSLSGEFTGHRWIPLTKASDAELCCFLWSTPKQTAEQTIGTPVI